MIKNKTLQTAAVILILWFFVPAVYGGNIRITKHNLSVSGPGPITAISEDRICIFCHIPHQNGTNSPYLWNRSANESIYTPYYSSTLNARVGQPTGSSRMCLSCHDGTIAIGETASGDTEIPFKGGIRFMPAQTPANQGTDLSDDHPVSMTYDASLAATDSELKDPSLLPSSVKLENKDQVQCISCHDPHDDTYGNFLVMNNSSSSLCIECHDKKGWSSATHARSDAKLDRSGGLWANTDYKTVAENGCENCHRPHSAGGKARLLYYAYEEDNCLVCHNGGVATTDIETVITKQYNHPVWQYTGIHDAAEDFASGDVPKHVECVDCHNPHQTNDDPSSGDGAVSGANRGVSGVSAQGRAVAEAANIYEICFKCHGDNSVITVLPVTRQIAQLNTRLEFDPSNPSFHPVEAPGKSADVPSLLSPYTTTSTISCTDCHGSDDPAGPRGPHGSDWQYILSDQYETADGTTETPSSYALCYKCHSRTSILNDESFVHEKHVVEQHTPCSACHDPHGVSFFQGNSINNSHLINFDLTIVTPDDLGRIEYRDTGAFKGECSLKCHGNQHDKRGYPVEGPTP
ncbi:MAG: hypothetical protein GXP53_00190 [Deltaproteobacteria bacterium]|nr:hypothetical protein [Deltaproteobacteria bacterium]